ncbi:MAG: hypothetical protein Crog4KO_27250 [Crocinitomicaceae bacterium]
MTTNSNMKPIQKEIEETLKSGDRIVSATASDALMQRLKQIPESVREGYQKVPKKVIWAVAASIALLIALNVYSAHSYAKEGATQNSESTNSYFDHLKTL